MSVITIQENTATANLEFTKPDTSGWKREPDYMDVVLFDDSVHIGVQDSGNYGEYAVAVHEFEMDAYAVQKLSDVLNMWLHKYYTNSGNEEPDLG